MKPVHTLALLVAFAAPTAHAAEDMYRSVMPDGSVRYGESPEAGAKSVRKIPPPPASTGTITVTPEEKGRSFEARQGGAVVIPPPERKRIEPAQQGRLQSPEQLPSRSY